MFLYLSQAVFEIRHLVLKISSCEKICSLKALFTLAQGKASLHYFLFASFDKWWPHSWGGTLAKEF